MSFPALSESSNKKILVIGASNLDIISVVDEMPSLHSSISAEVRTSYGGVARNIAENLARLGESVSLITAVGQDVFGKSLLEYTADSGVDVHACLECDNINTASYQAIINKQGKSINAFEDMRIFNLLTPDHIKNFAYLFSEAKMVFFDANINISTIRTILSLSRKFGIPVSADATSTILVKRLIQFVPKLFLVTANTKEASLLSENQIVVEDRQSALLAARFFINRGTTISVIPMAEFGVCYATSETNGHIPAMRTSILDSTGAGDALTASILFGLLNNLPLDDSIRLGVSAASLTLRHSGSVYPDLSLERLYDELLI